jgi:hypothetical protein
MNYKVWICEGCGYILGKVNPGQAAKLTGVKYALQYKKDMEAHPSDCNRLGTWEEVAVTDA